MPELSSELKVAQIVQDYPDCPQRDMALSLLRRGQVDMARAWLAALDELMANGRSQLGQTFAKKA